MINKNRLRTETSDKFKELYYKSTLKEYKKKYQQLEKDLYISITTNYILIAWFVISLFILIKYYKFVFY